MSRRPRAQRAGDGAASAAPSALPPTCIKDKHTLYSQLSNLDDFERGHISDFGGRKVLLFSIRFGDGIMRFGGDERLRFDGRQNRLEICVLRREKYIADSFSRSDKIFNLPVKECV